MGEEYKLKYPIQTEDKKATIDVLHLERIKVKHLKSLPKVSTDGKLSIPQFMPLLAKICNLTSKEVDEIDLDDLSDIIDIVGGQIKNLQSLETGET